MADQQNIHPNDGKVPRRKRSRGNPAIDLRAARQLLSILTAEHGDRPFSRDRGAQALGYASGTSGLPARKLAALVHFGLLVRRKGAFQVSPLGRQILSSSGVAEVRRARREAFLSPVLFREIVVAYQVNGSLPKYFAEALVAQFGIAEQARNEVARIFLASGQFAGVLNQDAEFVPAGSDIQPSQASPRAGSSAEAPPALDPSAAASDLKKLDVLLNGQGRSATLEIPQPLYREDIAALRRYLENVLEPLAIEGPSAVLPFKSRS